MTFYENKTTDNYVRFIGAGLANLTLSNDSAIHSLEFSFDGHSKHGVLKPNEVFEFLGLNEDSVYMKSYSPTNLAEFRIWFYGEQKIIYPPEQIDNAHSKQVNTHRELTRFLR